MLIEQTPNIIRLLYKKVFWRGDSNEKSLYLTFDDGPTEENTEWILDLLDKYGIKATFFVIGGNVEKHPELYKEITERGHIAGIHGYSHKRGLFKDKEAFNADIEKAAALIDSHLFRPPHGHLLPSQARKLGEKYKIVLWDVITRDYNRELKPEEVLEIAEKYARNGSVIVFHDSVKAMENMRYALPRAIEYWMGRGYQFKLIVNS